MRILQVAHTYLPQSRGGVENHVAQLCEGLQARGHEVGVLHSCQDRTQPEYAAEVGSHHGVAVHRINNNALGLRPTPFPYYDRQVEERFLGVLEAFRPDLVHVHHLSGLSTSLPGAAQRRGVPVIWTLHDFWPLCFLSHLLTPDGRRCPGPEGGLRCVECQWLQAARDRETYDLRERVRTLGWLRAAQRAPARLPVLLKDRLYHAIGIREAQQAFTAAQLLPTRDRHLREVVNRCDLRIAPSRFLRDRLVAWGASAEGFPVIPNGVPAALRALRDRAPRPGGPVRVGYLGTLVPYKGVHLLIEAFREVLDTGAQLSVWGAAPPHGAVGYEERLRSLAAGSVAIRFAGPFAPEALPEVLAGLDVVVVPSVLYENNPLSILEAQAAGIPVIAGDVGGMAEAVRHEVDGLHFRTGSPQDLAAALRRMADPGFRERLRQNAPRPSTIDEMVDAVLAQYTRVVEAGA